MFTTSNHLYLYLVFGIYGSAFLLSILRHERTALFLQFAGIVLHGCYLLGRGWLGGVFIVNPIYSIGSIYYPPNSLMRNRVLQTHVSIGDGSQPELQLSFLNPVSLNGNYLLLDMVKQKFTDRKKDMKKPAGGDETCNKAEVYHKTRQQDAKQKLLLLVVKDHGFFPICFGLFSILILMTWYFSRLNLRLKINH